MTGATPTIPAPPAQGTRRRRIRRSHGIRSGVVVGGALLAFSVFGYLFQTACIRFLGPNRFGDVAALLALTTVVAIPLGSVQSLLAREVSYLAAARADDQVRLLLRRTVRTAVPAAALVLVVSLALTVPIERALNIESAVVVVAGLSCLAFLVVGAILYGFLQGAQRFRPLAVSYAVSGAAKPALVVPALVLGFGATGALAVNSVASLLAVGLAAYFLRDLWGRPGGGVPPVALERREVAVLMVGSLAFASLTNIDVVLANLFLDGDSAGIYAAAALVGKSVLLLSAGVVTVLLPKAAARAASGGTSERILLLSAAVTLALSLAATAVLALVPEGLLVWAFGPDFRAASHLLVLFGLAMTAAALVNVYLFVYLAQKDARFPCLVALAATAQIVIVSIWHSGPRAIVITTLACSVAVLVVHELAFPHAVGRVLRGRRSGGEPEAA